MGWCEANKVDYLFVLARNQRLSKRIGAQMRQARALHQTTGKAARVFTGFAYITHTQRVPGWSRARRVVAKAGVPSDRSSSLGWKAEYLDKGENPRFVVTSLTPDNNFTYSG